MRERYSQHAGLLLLPLTPPAVQVSSSSFSPFWITFLQYNHVHFNYSSTAENYVVLRFSNTQTVAERIMKKLLML